MTRKKDKRQEYLSCILTRKYIESDTYFNKSSLIVKDKDALVTTGHLRLLKLLFMTPNVFYQLEANNRINFYEMELSVDYSCRKRDKKINIRDRKISMLIEYNESANLLVVEMITEKPYYYYAYISYSSLYVFDFMFGFELHTFCLSLPHLDEGGYYNLEDHLKHLCIKLKKEFDYAKYI
jgi:hypothetical protein